MNPARRLLPAALLLVLAAAAAAPAQEAPAPKTAEDAEAADRAALEALAKEAMPVVEKARGLAFKAPVPADPVTRERFVERYMDDFTRIVGGEEKSAAANRLLARLGILEEGTDLRALLGEYLKGNIAANYDPATKKMSFLPGVPRTLPLMVHELVHALDDQHFDMMAKVEAFSGSIDRALAYGALAEGDATSVQTRFAMGAAIEKVTLMGLRMQAEAQAAALLRQQFGATPPAVVLAFKSQYTEGLVFAEALRRSEKGEEAVNAAFRSPPPSTEQVLHPEKYLEGKDPPVELALPELPGGAKVLMSTTLGELGTRIALLAKGLPLKDAVPAAAGWGGDTAALVSFAGGEALLWTTAWDTEGDAEAFRKAMERAFPPVIEKEPAEGAKPALQRIVVQRGTTVEYVECPDGALEDAMRIVKGAVRR
jgi:hypothetical protein